MGGGREVSIHLVIIAYLAIYMVMVSDFFPSHECFSHFIISFIINYNKFCQIHCRIQHSVSQDKADFKLESKDEVNAIQFPFEDESVNNMLNETYFHLSKLCNAVSQPSSVYNIAYEVFAEIY